jgi:hypothetical protein
VNLLQKVFIVWCPAATDKRDVCTIQIKKLCNKEDPKTNMLDSENISTIFPQLFPTPDAGVPSPCNRSGMTLERSMRFLTGWFAN